MLLPGVGARVLELLLAQLDREHVRAVVAALGQPVLRQPPADHRAALAARPRFAAALLGLDDAALRHPYEPSGVGLEFSAASGGYPLVTMATCLVTGGAGFLGSHLCGELLRRGHRVICVDNYETGSLANIEHI